MLTSDDPVVNILPLEAPIEVALETPIIDVQRRNKDIITWYTEGKPIKAIAKEVGLSEPQIYNIVRNKAIIGSAREAEKLRRLRRLRLCESKAPRNLAPNDATELVRVIEAQRKELEGDGTGAVTNNNTQINVTIDKLNVMSLDDRWDMARKLLL